MPRFCSFYGCINTFPRKNVSSHRFPDAKKHYGLYVKWLENVNKNSGVKFIPTEAARICSDHFRADMKEEGGQKVILKPFAVPTIFPTSQVCVFVSSFLLVCFLVFNLVLICVSQCVSLAQMHECSYPKVF